MTRIRNRSPSQKEFDEAAALREALREFHRNSDLVVRTFGLTPRTYLLLLMVRTARDGNGVAPLPEIEARLQLGKSTITELVLRTEERGLVLRELDRTRPRGVAVRLTDEGERLIGETVGALGDERASLIETLSKLRGFDGG
jgi:DNA-binding MarR family transcriptional regulator